MVLLGWRSCSELDERPTGVFTVNNLVALGAIEAVRAAGLEVPDDVALVCYDDIEYASRLYPFLTVMLQPAETFGTLGTQLLFERIEGRRLDRTRKVVLPADFVVRRVVRRQGAVVMIVVAGEALIDLVERDGTLHPLPGGGPFNTAIALGRLGVPTGFLGRLSHDQFGELLVGLLRESGVDDRYVLRGSEPTPVAVVHMSDDGDAEYSFHLAGTAYAELTTADIPELRPEVVALHLGTLALATDPRPQRWKNLMRRESELRLIVVDPNVRPDVIGDRDVYRGRFESWLSYAQLVKLSARDAEWLYPELEPEACARLLLSLGARLAVGHARRGWRARGLGCGGGARRLAAGRRGRYGRSGGCVRRRPAAHGCG